MDIVDSHQHFWSLQRGDYSWLSPQLGVLFADYQPDDLTPQLANCGIRRTVLIQAAPTREETHYMLSLADKNEFVTGVVGWVDFESSSATADIAELASHPKFKGVRPMIHDIADPNWVANPEFASVFDALVEHDLVFDALVRTCNLESLMAVIARHTDLPIVIDHAAKPPIGSGDIAEWKEKISRIADNTHVSCKLSGLVTEARADCTDRDIQPIFSHLYREFGPDRLIWGSDWPVVKLRMDYSEWFRLTEELLKDTSLTNQEKLLCTNAVEFYNLDGPVTL